MDKYYSTIQDVINYSGLDTQSFLHTDTQEKLESQVKTWLIQVKALMDKITERDFHKELENEEIDEIDHGIHNIALRITANMVLQAQVRRQTDINTNETDLPRLLQSSIITKDIREELEEYKKGSGDNIMPFFIQRVRNRGEL